MSDVKKTVTLEIDGRTVTAPEGAYITAAAQMHGIDIPVFCGYEKMHPWAGCRICLVEVGLPRTIDRDGRKITEISKLPKLQAACAMPVSEGMVVWTNTPAVELNRKRVLEFLLINHPLECPVCDKGGECPLQDITYRYGLAETRMKEPKRVLADTDVNDFVRLNYKRCIHCKRCVRFHEEIAQDYLLEFARRGSETFIQPAPGVRSKFSGNQVEYCPVGALTSKPFRFKGRPWELDHTPSVCTGCAVGCNIEIHSRLGEVMRLWSRDNPEVDWGWLCDKGRFVYEQLYDGERVQTPLIRSDNGSFRKASWGEAIAYVAATLKSHIDEYGRESVFGIAGSRLTNETYYAFRKLLAHHIGTPNYHFGPHIPGLSANPARLLNALAFRSGSWEEVTSCDAILAWGVDILEEAPVLGLKIERELEKGKFVLLAASSHVTEGERMATAAFHYPYRRQPDALKLFVNAIAGAESAPDEIQPLLEYLGGAKSVEILFGNEVLSAPNASELIGLLLDLCNNLEVKLAAGTAETSPKVFINPVFRDGNAVGALLFNHLPAFSADRPDEAARTAPGLNGVLSGMASGGASFCYVIGADPVKNFPDALLAMAAFDKCRFTVVQDQFITETAKCANVILPALTPLEQEGTVISGEKRLQKLNRPDVRFKLADTDFGILRKLLAELKYEWQVSTPGEAFNLLAENSPLFAGVEYASIPSGGVLLHASEAADAVAMSTEASYIKYDSQGALTEAAGVEGNLFILVPKLFHYNGENHSMHSAHFREAVGEPYCELNPSDAKKLGIADGGRVEIASRAGNMEVAVISSRRVREGHVLISDSLPGLRLADLMTIGEFTVVNLVPVREAAVSKSK